MNLYLFRKTTKLRICPAFLVKPVNFLDVKTIKAAVELLRLEDCFMAVLGLAISSVVFGIDIFSIHSARFFFAALATFLICGGGNAINDYFDYKIDRINMPKRPIPSGRISRRGAFAWFWIVSVAGIAFSYFASVGFFAIALANFAVASLYGWKLKRTLLKNIYVSYLASAAFLSAGFINGFPGNLIDTPLFLLVSIAFLGTMSRQLLLDIRDVEGDKNAGAKTIPILLGRLPARIIASLFLLMAAALLVVPYLQKMVNAYYLILAVPAIILSIVVMFQEPLEGEHTLKKAIFLVLFAFLVGSV